MGMCGGSVDYDKQIALDNEEKEVQIVHLLELTKKYRSKNKIFRMVEKRIRSQYYDHENLNIITLEEVQNVDTEIISNILKNNKNIVPVVKGIISNLEEKINDILEQIHNEVDPILFVLKQYLEKENK
jgi:hypothetical protein